MSDTKRYLLFGDKNLCGFGNQLRSLVGWYLLSKLIKREFVITNTLINEAFSSPFSSKNFDLSNKTMKSCVPGVDCDFDNIDFGVIEEDVIEGGGPEPMLWKLTQNPFHSNDASAFFKKYKTHNFQRLSQDLFAEIIDSISPQFEKLNLYGEIPYRENSYAVVQFRSFYECAWEGIKNLDGFISTFIEAVKEHDITAPNIIVLSDSRGLSAYIKSKIEEAFNDKNIYMGDGPRCPTCLNKGMLHSMDLGVKGGETSLLTIKDWLILGKSEFIYSSGTSFAESAAQFFGLPHCFLNGQGKGFIDFSK
tara:strand:+ start:305 stop:1222 length:918 start_codon:yes stop_codon:yes gene_type:complete